MRILWIGAGGFAGTVARYWMSGWLLARLGPSFPYGTLAVNVLGSLLLGALMWLGLHTALLPPTARLALTTGLLGGFTTYSTFNYETLRYLQEGAWLLAALNVVVTVVVCLAAGWVGWAGTGLLFRA